MSETIQVIQIVRDSSEVHDQRTQQVVVSTTWTNRNPDTIWNRLAARLGRTPTNAEAKEEVRRILLERRGMVGESGAS